jgi:hypothetical protein
MLEKVIMKPRGKLVTGFVLACLVFSGRALAQTAEGYVASGTQCADVFVKAKEGVKFAPRVDAFAPAFIVKGKVLSTPVATCRLRKSSTKGDFREFHFECANSISYAPVTIFFRRGDNGSLIRFSSPTETVGSRYGRCNL